MPKETYTFKEILFGLKDEYLKVTHQLNNLKKYLLLEENNIENINIFLHQLHKDKDVQIVCFLYERKKTLEKILEKIMEKIGLYPNQKLDCIKEQNANFIFPNNSNLINHLNQTEFNQTIIDVYNNELVKHIEPIYCGTGYDGKPFLSILPHNIYACEVNDISIDYRPSFIGNSIIIASFNGKLSKEKIETSFEMTFPKSKFPKYYQTIIETSPSPEKPIDIIGNIKGSKKVELEIIEEPKKLILKKK